MSKCGSDKQRYTFNNSLLQSARMSGRQPPPRRSAPAERFLTLREPLGPGELERYYDLRWRVLREPWSQERGQERDQHEAAATHLGAWMGERLVGVGRLHFIGTDIAQIRYMAVEPTMQGKGIGGRILSELEQRAMQGGARRIVLNARDQAVMFYRQHGYSITQRSETLFNAIPHWEMAKVLVCSDDS